MFDTSRLTIAEQEVLAAALNAQIMSLELFVGTAEYNDEMAWRLWQARELRDQPR